MRLTPILLSLAVATLLCACKEAPPPPQETPEPILQGRQLVFPDQHPQLRLLGVVPVAAGHTVDMGLSAKLIWNEARTQRVYPAFAGRIEGINVDVGQAVKPGMVLASMASPDFGQAQADVARAQADQAQARQQLNRQRELLEAGIVARRDFEQAQAEAARSDAELTRAQARVRLYGGGAGGGINQQLALRANMGGLVVERNLNPGQELRPDPSGPGVPPLFVISDPSSLWVQIDARESEVASLPVGSTFALEVPAFPGKRFQGTVMTQADAIDANTRTIKVRGLIANPERLLKAEMLGTVHVQRALGSGVVVPPGAVLLRGDKQYVFLQPKPGVFESREVKVGYQGPREVVVAEGLQMGDQVVNDNVLLLAREFRMAENHAKPASQEAKQP